VRGERLTSTALKISDLGKSYGSIQAVQSLSLTVETGEIVGLIGPDGAGKTTLMRLVCGLIAGDSGKVEVFGFNPAVEAKCVREVIGYMPQKFSLYPDLSVSENIRFFADLYLVPAKERELREARLMEFSMLGPFRNRRAGQLSGGMKQKLALSCTLIHTPKLLILDEPTTGVDPVSRKEFWSILKDLASQGIALLISTPYMDEAALCDRAALMHKGRILTQGSPSEIISQFGNRLLIVDSTELKSVQEIVGSATTSDYSIHRFGGSLHIVADDAARILINNSLSKAGFFSKEAEPSMEDAFVALLSKQGVGE